MPPRERRPRVGDESALGRQCKCDIETVVEETVNPEQGHQCQQSCDNTVCAVQCQVSDDLARFTLVICRENPDMTRQLSDTLQLLSHNCLQDPKPTGG